MREKFRKHKVLLIVSLLLIIKLGTYYYGDFKGYVDKRIYSHYVNRFEKIRPTNAVNLVKQNKSTILIYFGRDTCPHCVKSIRNVYDMSKESMENNVPFYYIEEEDELSIKDNELINDVFKLEYIPSIVKIGTDNIEIFDYEKIENEDFKEKFLEFLEIKI